MDRAVVKFDALANADRAGTENDDALLAQRLDFVFVSIAGIVVRRSRFKFGSARINHLEGRRNAMVEAELADFVFRLVGKAGNDDIGHAVTFGQADIVDSQVIALQIGFQIDDVFDLMEEPQVIAGDIVNLFFTDTETQGLGDDEEPFVILFLQEFDNIDEGFAFELLHGNVVNADFQGADGFEQSPFKATVESHDFTGSLHLRAQCLIGEGEFFKGPARKFDDAVIQGRFKASRRLARDGIGNLVQGQARSNFSGNLSDGIARRFGSQGRRTADTGIDFDDIILIAVRVEGVLDVAAAFNLQAADDGQRSRTQHLVLQIVQGLARSDDDGVARMDTDGVDVFHVADDDAVIRFIAHNFVFDFFPAGHRAFDEDLVDRAEFDAARGDHEQFVFVMSDTAACTAEGKGRTDDDRVADLIGEFDSRRDIFKDIAFRYRLVDVLHGFLEEFAVFRFFNSRQVRTQELDVIFFQDAGIGQLDSHVQADLAAEGSQQAIRPFFFDDFCNVIEGNRFDIDAVGNVFIRHNRRRVAVDEDDFQSFFFQGAAGLGAGIVKFSGLTDDNRARTDNEYFLQSFYHVSFPPSS